MINLFGKKVTIFSDFDRTLVKESSGFLLILEYINEKKELRKKRIIEGFSKLLRYLIDKNTYHLAEYVKDIEPKTLISVAKKLHINEKWLKNIEEIKKKYNASNIDVIIVSRNLKELIEEFVKLHKEEFKKRNIKIVKIIANTNKRKFFFFRNKVVKNDNKFEFLKGKQIIYLGDSEDLYLKEKVSEFFEC